jgi:hypothetical protein
LADTHGGWTCHVEQGHYGHRARKPTWLYAAGVALPSLSWGPSAPPFASVRLDSGYHSRAPRASAKAARQRGERTKYDAIERMGRRERLATPVPFRDLLLSIARNTLHVEQFLGAP